MTKEKNDLLELRIWSNKRNMENTEHIPYISRIWASWTSSELLRRCHNEPLIFLTSKWSIQNQLYYEWILEKVLRMSFEEEDESFCNDDRFMQSRKKGLVTRACIMIWEGKLKGQIYPWCAMHMRGLTDGNRRHQTTGTLVVQNRIPQAPNP